MTRTPAPPTARHRLSWLPVVALSGCFYGKVLDATSGSGLASVAVDQLQGSCLGTGCNAGRGSTVTDSSGNYLFDAYGDYAGSADIQALAVTAGDDALVLEISQAGYQTVQVALRAHHETFSWNGTTYEYTTAPLVYLCDLLDADSDGDTLCDDAEAQLGTDPNLSDTDGDGFTDAAEHYGYNGIDFKYYGASPLRKDVFLEIDYYPGLGPATSTLDLLVAAFAAAPLTNPDGSTGISLHYELDDQIAPADADTNLSPAWTDFDVIKNKYFAPHRAPIFHYAVFANQYSGGGSSGQSRGIPGRDLMVTMGTWSTPGGTAQQQAGTLMHELGHNLGLEHGGDESVNFKPNYFSVMNYNYQLSGLTRASVAGVLDYSRIGVKKVDEASLAENTAFAPRVGYTTGELDDYAVQICLARNVLDSSNCATFAWLTGDADVNLDLDRDGIIDPQALQLDLDGDGNSTGVFQRSQNDWENLVYTGDGTLGGGPGAAARRAPAPLQRVLPAQMESCMREPTSP